MRTLKRQFFFQTKNFSVVCFSENLRERAPPTREFDSGGQNPHTKQSFMHEVKKKYCVGQGNSYASRYFYSVLKT